jgi:hypothetical protein
VSVPNPTINFREDPAMKAALESVARAHRVTVSRLLREWVSERLIMEMVLDAYRTRGIEQASATLQQLLARGDCG